MKALREAATLEEKPAPLAGVQEVWNETVPSAVYGHVEENKVRSVRECKRAVCALARRDQG